MHVTTTALDNGFIHIALSTGTGNKVRVICTQPDNKQMMFALTKDEVRQLRSALYDSLTA